MEESMMQFFEYKHLPPVLQDIAKPFYHMAEKIVLERPRNPERTAGLRKLLEAKDCIVRCQLFK